LSESDFKTKGFFVEFGAASGSDLSNTFLLERKFAWKGILAEPSQYWHNELFHNRPNSVIETNCVWSVSGDSITFHETNDPELSTIRDFQIEDSSISKSQKVRSYSVETVSLSDLLKRHGAPRHIDYLSIDTEGSEYEILKSFDFNEYSFGVITCEHNYKPVREDIFNLLTSNGYSRKFDEISLFDDWYVKVSS
jgi:FkbM family methyltransferase